MKAIKQASKSCSVDLEGDEVRITTALLSTDYEAYAQMKAADNCQIKQVQWEINRTPDGQAFIRQELPELRGLSIFSYSNQKASAFIDPEYRKIIAELLAECIRGVLQTHRFFGNMGDYSFLKNSCYFNSLPNSFDLIMERVRRSLHQERVIRLSQCYRTNHIFLNPDRSLFCTMGFSNSGHEILLTASISEYGLVNDISGSFLRFPHQPCSGMTACLNNLRGYNLAKMSKREIGEFVGGSSGCTHLVEMCFDLAQELVNVKSSSIT